MQGIYIIGEPEKQKPIKQALNLAKLNAVLLSPDDVDKQTLVDKLPMVLLPWKHWHKNINSLMDGRSTILIGDPKAFTHIEDYVLSGSACFLRENISQKIIHSTVTEILRNSDPNTW